MKRAWLRLCHEWTLRKCDHIVAISNVVKQDVLRKYGEQWADRIRVIWNPISLERFDGQNECNMTDGRPYVLCVAVDRPQKNLFRLIRAFALARSKCPDYCLVLAGQLRSLRSEPRERTARVGKHMPSAVDLINELGLAKHVRITGFLPDADSGALYRGSAMCVLPSLFEGFGMPAVESLAFGKPTLVSGLPVLREVTFGAAQYLDNPEDVDAMAERISTMLANPQKYKPSPDLIRSREN